MYIVLTYNEVEFHLNNTGVVNDFLIRILDVLLF